MQTVLYDGSFEGLLSAVFDIYEYRLSDVEICREENFKGNIFDKIHFSTFNENHSDRVWKGLENKISPEALKQFYRAFLSEQQGMETTLLHYAQHAFLTSKPVEKDYGHPAVLMVVQTAKKVWREKHRMEAFVRFQKTGDGLYFASIEPDSNVLPLIASHFESRYADQQWVIYDIKRNYGIYYNLHSVQQITFNFLEKVNHGKDLTSVVDEKEEMYQQLWQRYFKSVNIAARKNSKLHVQHMPRRYWKFLTEKNNNL